MALLSALVALLAFSLMAGAPSPDGARAAEAMSVAEATVTFPEEVAHTEGTLRLRGQLTADDGPASAQIAVRGVDGWQETGTDSDGRFAVTGHSTELGQAHDDEFRTRVRVTGAEGAHALELSAETRDGVTRLAGATRWDTMAAIAGSLDTAYDRAYVGSGLDYADALSAGPLAARDATPLLLSPRDRLLPQLRGSVEDVDQVTLVGGPAAVGEEVERELAGEGLDVGRLAGRSRWETSARIAREWDPEDVDVAYVAAGDGPFADALSGGAAATSEGAPLLLAASDEIPAAIADTLEHLAPDEIVLLGGQGAVSTAVEQSLDAIAPVERLSGRDRFATSAVVATSRFDPATTDTVFVSTGHQFADALAGVTAAAEAGAPILLADTDAAPGAVAEAVSQLEADRAVLLGGTGALSSSVELIIDDLLEHGEWTELATEVTELTLEEGNDGGGDEETELVSSVAQHGVEVVFDGDYEVGRFVTGDWFVVGEPTVTQVSPGWDGTRNGAMINPRSGSAQGYHAGISGYDASLNVAASLPAALQPGDSLVATTGWVDSDPGAPAGSHPDESLPRPALRDAMVLTVVDQAPAEGSFRPSYSDGPKELHSVSQLRWDRLDDLAPVASTPSWDELADRVARPWIDHKPGFAGYYIHPSSNMPDYGREIAAEFNEVTLGLLQAGNEADKRAALIGAVQVGIDIHGSLRNAALTHDTWAGGYGGGIGSGRKWPVLFAGLMLDDSTMTAVDFPRSFFSEDCYTYATSDGAWWADANCIDGSTQDSSYRTCCTANAWNGAALAARLMGAVDHWDHDPFFDYVDWHMANETDWSRAWTAFLGDAWDAHRR